MTRENTDNPRRKKHKRWTKDEIETIREEYAGTRRSQEELAHKLGTTRSRVEYQIYKMGLGKRKNGRPWTQEEDERLRDLISRKNIYEISKTMGRSLNAVTVRAVRIGAQRRNREGWYTQDEASEIMGVKDAWTRERIASGELKASWHHGRKPGQAGSGSWHIEKEHLREFLRRNPHELTARNVDLVQIVEILTGLLPHRDPDT